MNSVTVTKEMAGKTVKEFFLSLQFSTAQIKRIKFEGYIAVDGVPCTVRRVLRQGERLEYQTYAKVFAPPPSEHKGNVLFYDRYIYVADKPYDPPTHPDRAHRQSTLANDLAAYFGKGFELRIATRLDKTTSGIVLGAFDAVTARKLGDMLCRGEIVKTYCLLAEGVLQGEGEIRLPLLRRDAQNVTVVDDCGKPSLTLWQAQPAGECSLVYATPITGRTHQIRAHFAAIGHPVCGDVLYGARPAERIMLHCERLRFVHPTTGMPIEIFCPAPFATR